MNSSLQEKLAQGSSLDNTQVDSEFNRQFTEESLRLQAQDILMLTRPESLDDDEWELVEEEKVKSKKKASKKTKTKKKSKRGNSASGSPKESQTANPNTSRTSRIAEETTTTISSAVASAPASSDTNFESASITTRTHVSMSKSKMPRPSVSGQTFPGAERVTGMGIPSGRSVGLQEDYDIEQGVLHAPVREYSEELDATVTNDHHGDDIGKGGPITATAVTRADLEEEVRNRLMADVVTAQVIAVTDQPLAYENGLSTSNPDLEKSSSEETTTSIWTKRRSLLLKLLLILLAAAIAAIVVVLLLSRHPGGGEGSGYIENGNAQQQASASTTEDGGISQDVVPRPGED